jgi:hypothetical protein
MGYGREGLKDKCAIVPKTEEPAMILGSRSFMITGAAAADFGSGDGAAWAAVPQDEVRQDREHRFACGALDTPDGETTQPDADIMGVARQAPPAATGRLVLELKAKRQNEGEDTLEKRLPIAKELKVRRFVSKIHGDGAVVSRRFGRCAQVSPLCYQVSQAEETGWGEHVVISRLS